MKKILLLALVCFSFGAKAQYTVDFESWHSVMSSLTIPDGWNASDSLMKYFGALTNPGATFQPQIEKETPGYSGTGAMKAISKSHPGLGTLLPAGIAPCIASNCKIDVNTGTGEFYFTGGRPYTQYPTAATVWIKNNVVGGDSTSIGLYLIDNSDGGDSLVAWADTVLGANISNFTQLTLPFKYNPTPGFTPVIMRVIVMSSANFYIDTLGGFAGLNDGTSITVDDINVQAPAGVSTIYSSGSKYASVYPTQFQDKLNVDLQSTFASSLLFELFDLNGKEVYTTKLKTNTNALYLNELGKGIYIYRLSEDGKPVQSGKLSKR